MKARTRFVVACMAFLFVISWSMSLGRLLGIHFWDEKYALDRMHQQNNNDEQLHNATAMNDVVASYYSPRRHLYFVPHVFGALFWWNLYWIQLVPSIRHAYKKLHRILGRCLMVVAVVQTASGVALACTSHSNTIKLISLVLAMAVAFCIFNAYRYALHRDIPKHKYWICRLVGYMQAIALQRFHMLVLIVSHQCGWYGLYPDLEGSSVEQANDVVLEIFDHSFILSTLTALLATEWYLAGEQGMLDAPVRSAACLEPRNGPVSGSPVLLKSQEERPLMPKY